MSQCLYVYVYERTTLKMQKLGFFPLFWCFIPWRSCQNSAALGAPQMTTSDAAARAFQGAVSQAAKQLEIHGAPDTFRLSAQTCDETAQDLRRRFKVAAAEENGLELHAPMLVVPYAKFVTLGKLVRHTDAAWRKQAMADGLLVEFDPSTMIAGLISGNWWAMTSPDYEEGDGHGQKTNLMWRTICRGVGDVIAACGLDPSKVVLCVEVSRIPCHMTRHPKGCLLACTLAAGSSCAFLRKRVAEASATQSRRSCSAR